MGSSSSTAKKQKTVTTVRQIPSQNKTNNSSSNKETVRSPEKKETVNSATANQKSDVEDITNQKQAADVDSTNQNQVAFADTTNHKQVLVANSANQNKVSVSSINQKPASFTGLGEMDRWQDADLAGLLSGLSLEDDDAEIWKDTVDQLITRYDPKIQQDKGV